MSTDNPPVASSGDLREALAAAMWTRDGYDNGPSDVYIIERYLDEADAAISIVRAHDAAHPEPWVIKLVRSEHDNACVWHSSVEDTAICLAVPGWLRSAAGLT